MDCFILAGGQSRRFGGDKLLHRLGGKSTIEYVLETAEQVCDRVHLVVKESGKFKHLGVPTIEDALPFQSPAVGVYTALLNSGSGEVLVLAGDMPLLNPQVLRLLMERYAPPVTLFSIRGKLYPLTAVYSRELLGDLKDFLSSGGRSLVGFLKKLPYTTLTETDVTPIDPELKSFLNMNTREDLTNLMEMLA
ncbi:molybdenum cofactor guanylyltransferase MobA [Hydrogenivirga sp. 128-5-R1-1]|uniref:molybdenum cofactor guanylyltransferase MobA n=1 Tax=Hydrogenivirga sp. 128-5-R1-1 TaxID=392423 RepID=UPI00015EF96C|nr:molybdenum cofactor guanylyltransferase MobA [Hydrogenivirga sp. 128-5-R1-1]EDP75181.1 molybdopterin-guanine dinucleotide biosynthesis protein A [Hydrogenivirga sp. 128-5-R1-1]